MWIAGHPTHAVSPFLCRWAWRSRASSPASSRPSTATWTQRVGGWLGAGQEGGDRLILQQLHSSTCAGNAGLVGRCLIPSTACCVSACRSHQLRPVPDAHAGLLCRTAPSHRGVPGECSHLLCRMARSRHLALQPLLLLHTRVVCCPTSCAVPHPRTCSRSRSGWCGRGPPRRAMPST